MKKISFLLNVAVVCILFSVAGWSLCKEQAFAATTAFETVGFSKEFAEKLKPHSVRTGNIYVTNAEGTKIKTVITILDDQQTVVVKDLEPGDYTLYVKKAAFQTSSTAANVKIAFTITDELQSIQSKKELQDYFAAVLQKNDYGYKNAIETSVAVPEAAQDTANTGGDTSQSTTNNQVEGIEEGDTTVVNNRYIFSSKDQSVVITDAKDPKNLQQVATLTPVKSGYVQKIVSHNNLLLVVVDEYIQPEMHEKKMIMPAMSSMTKLFIYNVEDPANAQLVRIVGQEGYFQNIRKVGNTVYMVVNHTPNYWMMKEDASVELRPLTYDSEQSDRNEPMRYADLCILPGTVDGQYSIIKAIDVSSTNDIAVTTKGYLGGSSGLYMSHNALYLTAQQYDQVMRPAIGVDMIWMPQSYDTDIYKWDIDGLKIDFVGATTVKGTVLNQYSMDEHNGYFRIATTEGFTWNEEKPSKNHLFVLDQSMKTVGQLNDLAPGERIYSARFMGDKAYLVTFKQVDPLFVIDTSEPTNPQVLGELKIPGFSNYLHPLGDTHLIGIGYDTESVIDDYSKQPRIVTTSMKLSLFDVSDFNNPKEQQSVLIGGRGSYSEVQHDPKALFRHVQRGLYGFPVTLYDDKDGQSYVYQGSGAQIYEISTKNGISLKGNFVEPTTANIPYEDWERMVQRIVYIGDTLFTISRKEVKSYDLNNFELLDSLKVN